MPTNELCFKTATEVSRLVRSKELSAPDLVQAHLDQEVIPAMFAEKLKWTAGLVLAICAVTMIPAVAQRVFIPRFVDVQIAAADTDIDPSVTGRHYRTVIANVGRPVG